MCGLGLVADECGDRFPLSKVEIAMLVTRGMSLRDLEDFEGVREDLRGAVAAFHTKTDKLFGWPTHHKTVQQLLMC